MTRCGSLYVFEGPDGVGKTTLSKWFADTLKTRSAEEPYGFRSRAVNIEVSEPWFTDYITIPSVCLSIVSGR